MCNTFYFILRYFTLFIFVVLIEIFTKYFFGAEEKVCQFVMHQFATFIRFNFHYTSVYFNRIAKLSNFF